MIKAIIFVGVGGFLGSVCRYLLTRIITLQWSSAIPYGTFTVNILGSFLIGLLGGLFLNSSFASSYSPQIRLLLITGFCGGFTTFSTFSLEMIELFQSGTWMLSLGYALVSILLGFTAVLLGIWIAKIL